MSLRELHLRDAFGMGRDTKKWEATAFWELAGGGRLPPPPALLGLPGPASAGEEGSASFQGPLLLFGTPWALRGGLGNGPAWPRGGPGAAEAAVRGSACCALARPPPSWAPSPSLQQGVVLGAEHRPLWRPACPFKNAGGGLSVRARCALPLAAALRAAQRGPPRSITGFTSTFSRALLCGSTTLRRQAGTALRAW